MVHFNQTSITLKKLEREKKDNRENIIIMNNKIYYYYKHK